MTEASPSSPLSGGTHNYVLFQTTKYTGFRDVEECCI